ncbi:MAG: microviridin/marinostatin family tricyclic proteinase inhibitor [Scytonematopsis contorta HA4267-MV1]|jgi:hypothetical protein|nr:microviridin/marinostatin family tricyclic proteinase inhibitor [Scytonematopsis contorta HA4267-MV1]
MSDSKQQDLNSKSLPFFVRYLEGQFCEDLSSEEMEEVQGGLTIAKKPYSDHWDGGTVTTLKYPSDKEDGSPIKLPPHFPGYTKKYPSDGDDHIRGKYPKDIVVDDSH